MVTSNEVARTKSVCVALHVKLFDMTPTEARKEVELFQQRGELYRCYAQLIHYKKIIASSQRVNSAIV